MTTALSQKILLYCYIVILLFVLLFGTINIAFAQDHILNGAPGKSDDYDCKNCGGNEACKQYCGEYGLNDFVQIAVNISVIILGVSGSLALLAFVYGGVMFLISAGNKETIEKAKRTITGAVIGLVIVFASWAIINFIITSLGYSFGSWHTKK